MSARPVSGCAAGYTAADWRSLVAHRGEPSAPEPAGWAAAIEHLALDPGDPRSGCAACRRAALAADPTLVFRRLPAAAPLAGPAADPEVAAVQQAVAALRAASRVGASAAGLASLRPLASLPRRDWLRPAARWAAAAGLAAAALLVGSAGPGHVAVAPSATLAARAATPLTPTLAGAVPVAMRGPAELRPAQMPMLEELDRPEARVYQLDGANLSVVMIVDEKLDV